MRKGRVMLSAHKVKDAFLNGPIISDNVFKAMRTDPDIKRRVSLYTKFMTKATERAGKFDLGTFTIDEGNIIKETGEEEIAAGLFILPYPYSYWEFDYGDGRKYFLAVPVQDYRAEVHPEIDLNDVYSDKLHMLNWSVITELSKTPSGNFVTLQRSLLVGIGPNNLSKNHLPDLNIKLTSNKDVYYEVIDNPLTLKKDVSIEDKVVQKNGCIAVSLLQGVLVNKRVSIELEPAPEKLNKHRIKKGRTPLYAHHIVKIGGVSSCGNIVGVGMHHSSPRKHYRRSHTRVYHRGKENEKKIEIPWSEINGRGFVSKEYINDNMGKSDGKTKRS